MGSYKYNTSRVENGNTIPGVFLPAIIHNGNHYFTLLGIYQDAMIDCWGLCTFDEFVEKTKSGWVTNDIPKDKPFSIHHLIRISVGSAQTYGSTDDLIKDVRSAIDELNGLGSAQQRFINAIKRYRLESTAENLKVLKAEHDTLPTFYYPYIFGSRLEAHQEIQSLLGIVKNEDAEAD